MKDEDKGCAAVVIFMALLGALVIGSIVVYNVFIDPPPVTSAVQGVLDSCDHTWYTDSATWEGTNGTLVLVCKE